MNKGTGTAEKKMAVAGVLFDLERPRLHSNNIRRLVL